MLMSVDECFKCWMPAIIKSLGSAIKAREACERMRPVIERTKAAEKDGKISDMQPLMAMCNPTEDTARGIWRLEIRYTPVVDGTKGAPTSWITTILGHPDDRSATASSRAAIER